MYSFFRRHFHDREYVHHRDDDTLHKSSRIPPIDAFEPDLKAGGLSNNKREVKQYTVQQLRNIVEEMMVVKEEQIVANFKEVLDAEIESRMDKIIKSRKDAS